MVFIEPMHRNKPDITDLLTYLVKFNVMPIETIL